MCRMKETSNNFVGQKNFFYLFFLSKKSEFFPFQLDDEIGQDKPGFMRLVLCVNVISVSEHVILQCGKLVWALRNV